MRSEGALNIQVYRKNLPRSKFKLLFAWCPNTIFPMGFVTCEAGGMTVVFL